MNQADANDEATLSTIKPANGPPTLPLTRPVSP